MIAPQNWRESVERLIPGWLQEEWSSKWTGYVALTVDFATVVMSEALRASWLLEATSPDDVLDKTGFDRGFPRYPYESDSQYRARQIIHWPTWEYAGTEATLSAQFAALGVTATIYTDDEWPRPPTPWKSKFTVHITDGGFGPPWQIGTAGISIGPQGVYGVADGVCGDGSTAGDGTRCGNGETWAGGYLIGMTGDQNLVAAMRNITRTFKRGTEICLEAVVTDGTFPVCGDGTLCGSGAVAGGENITFSMV